MNNEGKFVIMTYETHQNSEYQSRHELPRQWVVEGRIVYGMVPEWAKTFFSSLEREDLF